MKIKQRGRNSYKPLLVYLFDKLPNQMDAIHKSMENLPQPVKAEAMSILDAYEARGEVRGFNEKTRQASINMIHKGFDNLAICEVLEVSEDYVQELRAQLEEQERDAQ